MGDHLSRNWDIWAVFLMAPFAVLISSFFFTGALDAYDEGMHYMNYAMFNAGKIPYVDYYPIFPPIWTYAHILIHEIFGDFLIVQRLWFVLQGAFVAFTSFIIEMTGRASARGPRFYFRKPEAASPCAPHPF